MDSSDRLKVLLSEAKKLAQEYYQLTGKPLGVTGEVAEYEAAQILNLDLAPARQDGYDAIEHVNGSIRKLQIKGRCIINNKPGQRLGKINTEKEWDSVLLVILDQNYHVLEIYEAERGDVIDALDAPGSKARNERRALSVSQFKRISTLKWKDHSL